jgi:uncharacterized protein with NAD-binding domain and iron-sulfur cluster
MSLKIGGSGGKTRIAILGGGPSALTAAFYLTSDHGLRDRYDITVYQMGWRVGGKGASGRAENGKILEHGLHILFGCYHDFFSLMRDVYDELKRPPTHPIRTWHDGFQPHDFGVVECRFDGNWAPWCMKFPKNSGTPGSGGLWLGAEDYLSEFMQGAIEVLFGWKVLSELGQMKMFDGAPGPSDGPLTSFCAAALTAIYKLVRKGVGAEQQNRALLDLVNGLRRLLVSGLGTLAGSNANTHRVCTGVDMILALLAGMVEDGVLGPEGFDFTKIDDYDLRDWLRKHGARPETLETPWVRTIYDAAFSYTLGDPATQSIAAGAALRAVIGMSLYKGSMYYKMTAGMGDVVFAPLYQVLKNRGVKFEFFHKVESLGLSSDKTRVDRVIVNRQVNLKNGYDPLVDVGGLPCWPAEPRWDQIVDGEKLRGTDLESYYSGYEGAETLTLREGEHFDQVLFAIPIGAVPFLCSELVDHSPKWKGMVQNVKSIQTLAFQIWTKPTLAQMGWDAPPPLLSLYVQPLNTWADMTQVRDREAWPANATPGQVSYFCGSQIGPDLPPPPGKNDFEERMKADAKAAALDFLRTSMTALLPLTGDGSRPCPPNGSPFADRPVGACAFDWGVLFDPSNRNGEGRFDAQYWRSNAGPSERCTIAQPGSIKYRIAADQTGYENLFIAGDWTENGVYVACMEGSVQSGILAARAISGRAFPIVNDWFQVTRGALHERVKP